MSKLADQPIRIVIADDHEVFREGLDAMLKKQQEIELVGEAANGRQLVDLALRVNPDVIVTDIKMPEMDGIEATKTLLEKNPVLRVIALSMFDDENMVVNMLEAGASGYLLKNAHKNEIIEAIRAVNANETYFCDHTTYRLAKLIGKSRFNPYNTGVRPAFTKKEISIIQLICQEYVNKEIAEKLFLSIRTIEGYREKILEKMNARNTAGIVIYAIKQGIYKL